MTVDGQRRTRFKEFDTYSAALEFGKAKVAESSAGELPATGRRASVECQRVSDKGANA